MNRKTVTLRFAKRVLPAWMRLPVLLVAFAVGLCARPGESSVPTTVNYQGSLRQNGLPANGSFTMLFRLTDAAGGTEYWTSGSTAVVVSNGIVSYRLGADNAASFGAIDWDAVSPYLEVSVDGTTLLPREPLSSGFFAVRAAGVAAGSVGNLSLALDPLSLAKVSGGLASATASSITVTSGILVRSTGSGAFLGYPSLLHLEAPNNFPWYVSMYNRAAGDGAALWIDNDGALRISNVSSLYAFALDPAGRVGVGVVNPAYVLDVGGQANATQLCIAGDCKSSWGSVSSQWTNSGADIFFGGGNVGIGTTTPTDRLHVAGGNINAGGGRLINLAAPSAASDAATRSYVDGAVAAGGDVHLGSTQTFTAQNTFAARVSVSSHLYVTNGNVGIGTASPGQKLEISGADAGLAVGNRPNGYSPFAGYVGKPGSAGGWGTGSAFLKFVDVLTEGNAVSGDGTAVQVWTGVAGQAPNLLATFAPNGSLGIGTEDPVARLHVVGGDVAVGGDVVVGNPTLRETTPVPDLLVEGNIVASGAIVQSEGVQASLGSVGVATRTTAGELFKVGTGALTVLAGGNVGIGLTNPSQMFQVHGPNGSPATSGSTQNGSVAFSLANTYTTLYFGGYAAAPYAFWMQSGHRLLLENNLPLVINPNGGDVGIGTTAPGARLEINDADANTATSGLKFTNFACTGTDKLTVNSGGSLLCAADQTGSGSGNIIDTLYDTLGAGNDAQGRSVLGVGSLGIGTVTPDRPLHVYSGAVPNGIHVQAAAPGTPTLAFLKADNTAGTNTPAVSFELEGTVANAFDIMGKTGASPMSSKLNINLSNGNVGIGTSTPAVRLEVAGIGRFTGTNGFSVGDDAGQYRIQSNAGQTAFALLTSANQYAGLKARHLSIGATYGDAAAPANTALFEGNVGIGTTTPGYTLDVNGQANATQLCLAGDCKASWAAVGTPGAAVLAATQTFAGQNTFAAQVQVSSHLLVTNGNVGIGTANPAARLEVNGGAIPADTFIRVQDATSGVGTGKVGLEMRSALWNTDSSLGLARIYAVRTANGTNDIVLAPSVAADTPAEKFRLTSGGNVGIGTPAPNASLEVKTAGAGLFGGFPTLLQLSAPDSTPNYLVLFNQTANQGGSVYVSNGGNTHFGNAADTEILTIGANGKVGIQNTAPAYTLDVAGVVRQQGAIANTAVYLGATGGIPVPLIIDDRRAAGNISLMISSNATNTGAQFVVQSDGKVGIGTASPSANLEVRGTARIKPASIGYLDIEGADPTYAVRLKNPNGNLHLSGGKVIFEYSGGSGQETMRITDAGSVGIGTTTPSQKLDVNGIVNAAGFYVNGSPFTGSSQWTDGTAGAIYYNGGNVGIGTAGPAATLDVNGDVAVGPRKALRSSTFGYNAAWKALVLGSTGTVYNSDAVTVSLGYDPSGNPSPSFTGDGSEILVRSEVRFLQPNAANNGYSYPLTLKDGNVGVGMTLPQGKLQVGEFAGDNAIVIGAGAANAGRLVFNRATGTQFTGGVVYHHDSEKLGLQANAAERLTIDGSGNVGIGTASPASSVGVARFVDVAGTSAGLSLHNDAGVNWEMLAVSQNGSIPNGLAFARGGSIGVAVSSTGNVGIGTTSPGSTLEVAGQMKAVSSFATYAGDGFDANARPGLTVITPGGPNAKLMVGYQDVGNGQYPPAIKFQRIGTVSQNMIISQLQSETYPRFAIQHDGNIYWGTGAATMDASLYRGGVNTIATGGTLTVGSNVGIGTTTPVALLHINNSGGDAVARITSGSTAQGHIEFGGPTTLRGAILSNDGGQSGGAGALKFSAGGIGNDHLVIQANGNVGIGTANPQSTLHTVGNARFEGGDFLRVNSAAPLDQKVWRQYVDSNSWYLATMPDNLSTENLFLRFIRSGTTVTSASFLQGNVGIGTGSPAYKLQVAGNVDATGFTVNGTPVGTSNSSYWSATGSNIFYTSGNVGVGTISPAAKLEVSGGNTYLQTTSIGNSGSHYQEVGYNVGFTATSDSYTYRITDTAASIRLGYNGGLEFRTAPSGTAGNPLTLTNVMNITQAGNVGIGTANPNVGSQTGRVLSLEHGVVSGGYTSIFEQMLDSQGSPGKAVHSFYDEAAGSGNTIAKLEITGANNKTGKFSFLTSDVVGTPLSRMVIDGSGNVGIGTTAPNHRLHVVGANGASGIKVEGTSPNFAAGGAGMILDHTGTDGRIVNNAAGALTFITNTDTIEKMRITAAGNVGIGTATPAQKLDVNGIVNAAGFYVNGSPFAGGASQWLNGTGGAIYYNAGNVGIGTTGPAEALHVKKDQNDLTTVRLENTSTGASALSRYIITDGTYISAFQQYNANYGPDSGVNIASTTLVYSTTPGGINLAADSAGGIIRLYTGGQNERVRITSSGNVGIGTTSPADRLHVSGGNMTLSNTNGTTLNIKGTTGSSVYLRFVGDDNSEIAIRRNYTGSLPNVLAITNTSANPILTMDATTRKTLVGGALGNTPSETLHVLGNVLVSSSSTGSPILYVSTTGGNVGIGTTSPGTKLDILNTGGFTGITVHNNGSNAAASMIFQNTQAITEVGAGITPGSRFEIKDDVANATRLLMDSSGKFGIGNAGPTEMLDVTGNINLGDAVTDADYGINLIRGGGVTHQGQARIQVRHSAQAGYSGALALEPYWYNGSAYAYYPNALVVDATGNVGIGTANPAYKLDVNGAINATSVLVNGVAVGAGGTQWASGTGGVISYTGGNVGIGTTQPQEHLDIQRASGGTFPTATIHLSTGGKNGGYIQTLNVFNDLSLAGGSHWNGTAWIAEAANTGILQLVSGRLDLYLNDGLTAGGTFSPTKRLTVTTAGNVGIGTTSPVSKLEAVTADSGTGYFASFAQIPLLLRNTDSTNNNWNQIDFMDSAAHMGSLGVQVTNHTTPTADLVFGTVNGPITEKMRITSAGNVGIGTASPGTGGGFTGPNRVLEIAGTAATVNAPVLTLNRLATGQESKWNLGVDSNKNLVFWGETGGTRPLQVEQGAATNSILVRKTGIEIATHVFVTSGLVGIGTTSPAELLDVAGNIRTSGVITMDRGAAGSPQLRMTQGGTDRGYLTFYNATGVINLQRSGNGTGGINIDAFDRVGIGMTSPVYTLDVNGDLNLAAGSSFRIGGVAQSGSSKWTDGTLGSIYRSAGYVGVGIATPDTKVHIEDASRYLLHIRNTGEAGLGWGLANDANGSFVVHRAGVGDKVFVDPNGNVGIGAASPKGRLQIGNQVSLDEPVAGQVSLAKNAYYDGSQWRYIQTAPVAALEMEPNGNTFLYTSPSGTAGTVPVFASRLSVLNSGNVGIGTSSPESSLVVAHEGGYTGDPHHGYNTLTLANAHNMGIANGGSHSIGSKILFKGYKDAALSSPQPLYSLGTDVFGDADSAVDKSNFFIRDEYAAGAPIRFFIDSNGNVGIGTTSVNATNYARAMTIDASTTGQDAGLELRGKRTGSDGGIGQVAWINAPAGVRLAAVDVSRYGADNSGKYEFALANAGAMGTKMTILPDGNVGIGTTSPSSTLSFGGSAPAIGVETSDGADNKYLTLQGASGASTSRGGYLVLFGNEVPSQGGQVYISASGAATTSGAGDIVFGGNKGSGQAELARIVGSSGNVGIGTANPGSLLSVGTSNSASDFGGTANAKRAVIAYSSNNTVVGSDDGFVIRNENTTANNTTGLHFATSTGAPSGGAQNVITASVVAINGARTANQYSSGALAFLTSPGSNFQDLERMRIDQNGNVGIGTSNPLVPLHIVYGNTDTAALNNSTLAALKLSNPNDVAGDYAMIKFDFHPTNGDTNALMGAQLTNASNGTADLVFATRNGTVTSEKVRILGSGNVGIGTSNPTAKLHIGGTAGVDGIRFPDGSLQTTASGVKASTTTAGFPRYDTSSTSFGPCVPGSTVTMTTNGGRVLVFFSGVGINAPGLLSFLEDGSYPSPLLDSTKGITAVQATGATVENAGFSYLTNALPAGSHSFCLLFRALSGTAALGYDPAIAQQFGAIEQ